MSNPIPKAICLMGPTASGKTDLGILLAKQFPLEIINTDAYQIYSELSIGTNRPSEDEFQGIPHHLFGVIPPHKRFTAFDFFSKASTLIPEINYRNHIPILIGGTGLYFNLLFSGIFEEENHDEELRLELLKRYEKEGTGSLFHELQLKDPQTADSIDPRNVRRLIRALEVCYIRNKPYSEIKNEETKAPDIDYLKLSISIDRSILYQKIDQRCETMVERGFLEEVKALRSKGYAEEAPIMQGIGYKELGAYLEGDTDFEEAMRRFKRNSRRLVKKQLAWIKRFENVHYLDPSDIRTASTLVSDFIGVQR